MKAIAWSIAGIDPTTGAGVYTDLNVFNHFGVQAAAVVTALTAQNAHQVLHIDFTSALTISTQIKALESELFPNAIKIGMLGNVYILNEIKHFLAGYQGQVVLDPILFSSTKKALFQGETEHYIRQLLQLLPHITLLTPNIYEAEKLSGISIHTVEDVEAAAKKILSYGVKNVLVKGGHFIDSRFRRDDSNIHLDADTNNCYRPSRIEYAVNYSRDPSHCLDWKDKVYDYFTDGKENFWLTSPRYVEKNYRGTGCTYSSAITALLALNYSLKDAIVIAKMYINRAIRLASMDEASTTYLVHGSWPEEEIDLPYLSDKPLFELPHSFPPIQSIGLYPVVDSYDWVKRLLPVGIKTIQLRIKDKRGHELENEIKQAIAFANTNQTQLFINDYWELAIRHQAYGVHLGQEDLTTANIAALRQSGVRLGISTHCYYEVARAHTHRPSYIASGPIYDTTSKIMPFSAQGIDNLARWQRTLTSYPLVAIGGINSKNIQVVSATGVAGIALISAITKAEDPINATQQLLARMSNDKFCASFKKDDRVQQ